MRLLHCNIVSCVIVTPNLAAIASVLTPTTTGRRIGDNVAKYKEQDKEKAETAELNCNKTPDID